MARQYKVKRYYKSDNSYKAKPHPVSIAIAVLAVAALVFVGISIYEPVINFFERLANRVESDPISEPESSIPISSEAESSGAEPEQKPVPTYPETRAVYLPGTLIADPVKLDGFLESLDGTDINTVMIDIKDSSGNILFNTKNPQAARLGTVSETAFDLTALAERLSEKDLGLAVRMHVFRDAAAASANRDLAIRYQNTEWLWLDNAQNLGGKPWLNPYSEEVRQYITSLATEAADAGACLVVLDSLQFPFGSTSNANFGPRAGVVSRGDILKSYLDDLSAALEEKNARVSAYIAAISLTQPLENESRYGGSPLLPFGGNVVLGCLPYQFGERISYEGISVDQPVARPGFAVNAALSIFLTQVGSVEDSTDCIPLLQGGNESGVNDLNIYTKAQIDAQIAAAKEKGLNEYILYSTGGDYLIRE